MPNSTAIFACSDVEETLAHYKDVLGFTSTWTWGEPPSFGGASRDGVSLLFNLQPELAAKIRGHQHWIKLDDADEWYREHVGSGAKIIEEIGDRTWGFREYVVEDLNGYHLRFAGPPLGEVKKSAPFPEGVVIERNRPSAEEYVAVTSAAFENSGADIDFVERTWNFVVARDPAGAAIGVLRIMYDAHAWFSIWDVAVVPEWQARGIGSAMMREAIELIREVSPGAIVHLFTFKHGFYEKLGFSLETASLRRL